MSGHLMLLEHLLACERAREEVCDQAAKAYVCAQDMLRRTEDQSSGELLALYQRLGAWHSSLYDTTADAELLELVRQAAALLPPAVVVAG